MPCSRTESSGFVTQRLHGGAWWPMPVTGRWKRKVLKVKVTLGYTESLRQENQYCDAAHPEVMPSRLSRPSFFFFFFLHMGVLFAYLSVHYVCLVLEGPEEGVGSLGIGVTDYSEPLCGC